MDYDVIIVGAGLGGLTAGAKLAKEGLKVLLLEQHTIPGGCATTFRRGDFKIEVGLHEIDGLDKDDPKSRIFTDFEILENLDFVRVPEFFRLTKPGLDIVIPDNTEKAKAVLAERFPAEKKGISKFFKTILTLRREVNRIPRRKWLRRIALLLAPILFPHVVFYERFTIGKLLDKLFKNDDLKLVLLSNVTYYHNDPYSLSLLFYALGHGSFFSGGGHFIKGGSQELSNYLESLILDNGGEVFYGCMVNEIVVEEGTAVGVKFCKHSNEDGELEYVSGNRIIANAALPNVLNQLVKDHSAKEKLSAAIGKPKIAPSILTIYFGFKRPPKELGNHHYSTIVMDDSVSNPGDMKRANHTDFSRRSFIFVDYDQLDSGLAPEGKSVGVLTTMDRLSDWETLSEEDYYTKKKEVAQILISRLEKLIPGIKNVIEYYEVATPKTIKRYTLNPEGTAYGYAQLPSQAGRNRTPLQSPIKNLFFASAWSEPGHGFTGVILGGYWCAEKILRNW